MNSIYDNARYQLLTAQLNWLTMPLVLSAWGGTPGFFPADVKIVDLVTRGFTELGFSMAIVGQTVTPDGFAKTNPVLIPEIPVGPSVTWFTFSRLNTSSHTQSQLVLFIDQADVLPFVPNGLDLVIQPDWLAKRGWWRP
jgi:hypothetical protein